MTTAQTSRGARVGTPGHRPLPTNLNPDTLHKITTGRSVTGTTATTDRGTA